MKVVLDSKIAKDCKAAVHVFQRVIIAGGGGLSESFCLCKLR